ncbi:MAG: 3-beta hydroxysteroid dehydrogenase [Sphingobium sp.]|uniref:glucose 1-dehydrogenase n=1 Tax=Sphingobium sp. TaxID=1912891 RepID=UPI000DB503BC|nr:glucose 1-dehydrogenase [Sphingobium sp.]PZU12383.1 MAG: 3-beta hydroxysteroid dehydrogenase [Sphingobium sp.]
MTGRLEGKIGLITGAGSGLGAAIASRFVAEGAHVLVTDVNVVSANGVASSLGSQTTALKLDVTDLEDWADAISFTEREFGGLHLLVNNAGICLTGSVEDVSIEDWKRTHAIDLDGVFYGIRSCLPLMRASTIDAGGAIINISSISGVVAAANMAAYNSAKAAVRHLTKSVALHCAKSGGTITCNSLHPTFIDTPLLDGFAAGRPREEMVAKLARQIPLGRVGTTDDVAGAAVYFCSDEARFITGAELVIDGGLSAM